MNIKTHKIFSAITALTLLSGIAQAMDYPGMSFAGETSSEDNAPSVEAAAPNSDASYWETSNIFEYINPTLEHGEDFFHSAEKNSRPHDENSHEAMRVENKIVGTFAPTPNEYNELCKQFSFLAVKSPQEDLSQEIILCYDKKQYSIAAKSCDKLHQLWLKDISDKKITEIKIELCEKMENIYINVKSIEKAKKIAEFHIGFLKILRTHDAISLAQLRHGRDYHLCNFRITEAAWCINELIELLDDLEQDGNEKIVLEDDTEKLAQLILFATANKIGLGHFEYIRS